MKPYAVVRYLPWQCSKGDRSVMGYWNGTGWSIRPVRYNKGKAERLLTTIVLADAALIDVLEVVRLRI